MNHELAVGLTNKLRQHQREQVKKSKLFKNLSKAQSLSDEPDQNLTTWQQLAVMIIEQSGTTITVQRFIMLTVISALGATIIVGVLWRGPVTTILAGLLAGVAPFAYIWRKRRLRLQKTTFANARRI
jgi:Flp pilus assembly protein TadB